MCNPGIYLLMVTCTNARQGSSLAAKGDISVPLKEERCF
uniref:Uncharacterized protein n=1 Tax=Anguilla anguilla TaxID=7936 RepID=A0A0E9XSQ1_ANGAN